MKLKIVNEKKTNVETLPSKQNKVNKRREEDRKHTKQNKNTKEGKRSEKTWKRKPKAASARIKHAYY